MAANAVIRAVTWQRRCQLGRWTWTIHCLWIWKCCTKQCRQTPDNLREKQTSLSTNHRNPNVYDNRTSNASLSVNTTTPSTSQANRSRESSIDFSTYSWSYDGCSVRIIFLPKRRTLPVSVGLLHPLAAMHPLIIS